jgi:hypothetical protein
MAILLGDVLAPLPIALNLEYAATIAMPPDTALLGRRYHLRRRAAARKMMKKKATMTLAPISTLVAG